jgi:hypothetical protein
MCTRCAAPCATRASSDAPARFATPHR